MNLKIVTYVPVESLEAILDAIGDSGAGVIGNYTHCSFAIEGVGRFLPGSDSSPAIGTPGVRESVVEHRVEFVCEKQKAKKIVSLIRQIHPYEEVPIDIYELIPETEL